MAGLRSVELAQCLGAPAAQVCYYIFECPIAHRARLKHTILADLGHELYPIHALMIDQFQQAALLGVAYIARDPFCMDAQACQNLPGSCAERGELTHYT